MFLQGRRLNSWFTILGAKFRFKKKKRMIDLKAENRNSRKKQEKCLLYVMANITRKEIFNLKLNTLELLLERRQ